MGVNTENAAQAAWPPSLLLGVAESARTIFLEKIIDFLLVNAPGGVVVLFAERWAFLASFGLIAFGLVCLRYERITSTKRLARAAIDLLQHRSHELRDVFARKSGAASDREFRIVNVQARLFRDALDVAMGYANGRERSMLDRLRIADEDRILKRGDLAAAVIDLARVDGFVAAIRARYNL